ncbi:Acyl dehydratase [Blastococcus aggregatus]|uniref:Acyl dehydratase n=1 Tax=Blastococcus aggregatus TaxID=38502 RepID=A0A285V3C4_9ACTN|nr:MaoC/PaaZ C-terminal domain-containing protein [Blastococcus aggregatus]SOC48560.1 Acyl dehydratase [Blastococcus aggregatus]
MYFEDLSEGAVYRTGSHVLTADELREFAAAYDPQPMHLDRDFAARGPFGDVIASGFQTMALAWRLWVDTGMGDHGRGGIGLGEARWHRPLYAGTEVRSIVHIDQVRLTSQGKGLATMRFELVDQDGQLLLEFSTTGLFARLADEVDSLAVER